MKMTRYVLSMLACVLCCSFGFSLVVHQVGVTDPANCATITYPGTYKLMVVNLFKVNGQVRSDYLDKTLLGSYNQIGSLGFSVQVPAGMAELEIIHLKRKEIVKITGNFGNKQYTCDFSKGYEIYEETENGERKPVELTIEQVPTRIEDPNASVVLHADVNKKHPPVIFRVNGQAPTLERKAWNNYCFNEGSKPFDITVPEGRNVIELAISTTVSGYSGHKYLVVQKIEFTAEKGKKYAINIHEEKIKKVVALHATIDEVQDAR